jgi:transcriptional regulator with XRE-family HTH domain
MNIGARLEKLIAEKKRSVRDVSMAAGVNPSTVYGIIQRDNKKVSLDVLSALAGELGVTLDYFMLENTNNNTMTLSDEEKDLLESYRELTEEQRQRISDIAQYVETGIPKSVTDEMNIKTAITEIEAAALKKTRALDERGRRHVLIVINAEYREQFPHHKASKVLAESEVSDSIPFGHPMRRAGDMQG